jgi:CPA1 family monovalent cation:H+ antiporter
MALFETIVSLLFISALLLHLSRWLGAPYPTMLALAGAAVAAFSWAPRVTMDPQLAMALFVAPAILDSAYDTSPRELKRNWLPLIALAVFAVVLTSAAVAWLGWGYAGLPLAAAIALGAIVAPPDAAAATAVLGSLRIPRRTMSILQGESLLNDAVALLIFGAALAFAQGGTDPWVLAPRLLWAAPGGVLLGLAAGFIWTRLWHAWAGTLTATILEFAITFGLWMLAERLGVSPVLAIVAYAMLIARQGPERQRPRDRLHSASVWDAAVFTLNVLAFLLMGFQVRGIVLGRPPAQLLEAARFALAVIACLIIVRMAWVLLYNRLGRLFPSLRGLAAPGSWRQSILVGWCGMRGLVTLATALALPDNFPKRELIVLTAFAVVLATLVVQGLTLAPLVRLLKLDGDDGLPEELARARADLAAAALASLEGKTGAAAEHWRFEFDSARHAAEMPGNLASRESARDLGLAAIHRQRDRLEELRSRQEIGSDVYVVLQEELDFDEIALSSAQDRRIEQN